MIDPGSHARWLEYVPHARERPLHLFCFPHAGDSGHHYRRWQRHLPPDVGVCTVVLPGRGVRFGERPYTRIEPTVTGAVNALERELDTPYALFGHSMGALLAFEVARELRRRRGPAPVHLFVSGQGNPRLHHVARPISSLPETELVAWLRRLEHTPRELLEDPEARALFLPTIRADLEVVDTYEYRSEPPLSCGISAYGGVQDEGVPLKALRSWKEQTSGTCTVRTFAGGHFFIKPPATAVLRTLHRELAAHCAARSIERR